MKAFARLLDDLYFARATGDKQRLLVDYFRRTPDPDRGYALGALTGDLRLTTIKAAALRDLLQERLDPVLVALSYDYVGDLSETASLLWPLHPQAGTLPLPGLAETVDRLQSAGKATARGLLVDLLDIMDPRERYALLKLATGSLRVGVTARSAKRALAAFGARDVAEIEGVWHRVALPYTGLFAWLEGRGPEPAVPERPVFTPVMLAHPLEAADQARLDLAQYAAEWKWDGVRVQLAAMAGGVALYTRTGEEIGAAFPEVIERAQAAGLDATLDAELLVTRAGSLDDHGRPQIGSFNDLQQRLNRKTAPRALLTATPAFLRAYDLLRAGQTDWRPQPWAARRDALRMLLAGHPQVGIDLSEEVPFASLADLERLRLVCAADSADYREGLMLKRRDSPYLAGRPKGHWWKWKRDPLSFDCVMMYAQRGHGKRSSYYSDFTFGVFDREGQLVPVGKAYSGYTDDELVLLDRWIRNHTTQRFGPVREVEKALVLEVICDALQPSTRHKSGIAMRFPRIARIRWDKPAAEADRLERLLALVGLERPGMAAAAGSATVGECAPGL